MSRGRLAGRIVAGGTVAWAAGCAVLYRRAFAPARWGPNRDRGWTPDDLGVDHERLPVRTPDGVDLLAWYLPGSLPAVVVVSGGHRGRAGDVLGISTALQRRGLHVAVFGWRGTPGSGPGLHTLGVTERIDLGAVVDAVDRRLGGLPLGLLGYSLGGAVSLVVAADDPRVGAVCSDSAFADPLDVLADGVRRVLRVPGRMLTLPALRLLRLRHGHDLRAFRPLEAVARIAPRPLLLIHGALDTAVGIRHLERLRAAAGPGAEVWVEPEAIHVGAYFADRRTYVDRVGGFFVRALAQRHEG